MGKMNRVFTTLLTGTLLTVCALLLLMGCGGGGGHGVELVAAANTHADTVQVSAGDLPVPDGVDPDVWSRIVAEFTAQTSGYAISKPPQNEANRVDDLVLITEGEDAPYLIWGYRNRGDYNLDGLVNASDLTPIGVHYGKTTASADWARAQAADGNGDGEVGLGDITPIGQNYLNHVVGYLLESSADGTEDDEWAEVARATIDDLVLEAGQSRPQLRLAVDAVPAGYYVRVTPFCYDAGGIQTEAGVPGASVMPMLNRRGDWWMEGRDNYHSGVSSLVGPATCNIWWSLEIEGVAASGPVVDADGMIYIGGSDGLFIIEPDGGSFQCCTTADAVTTIPAMALDGTIYAGCNDGQLLALGPDGAWRWSFQATGPLTASPAVAPDGTVWFADAAGVVYGLDPDGSVREQADAGTLLLNSPAVGADGRVYFGTEAGALYVYPGDAGDITTLGTCWPVLAELPYYATDTGGGEPGYIQREMLFTNDGLTVTALATDYFADPADAASITFTSELGFAEYPLLVGADGAVSLLSEDHFLLGYTLGDTASNQAGPAWQSTEPVPHSSDYSYMPMDLRTTVDAEGNYYIQNVGSGWLVARDAEGGLRWYINLDSPVQPVLAADHTLLTVSADGSLLAFGGMVDAQVPGDVEQLEVEVKEYYTGTATLKWTPCTGAAGYEIFRNSTPQPVATMTASGNSVSGYIYYEDEGLEPGIQYTYEVRAVNLAGPGGRSPAATVWTPLAGPGEFAASRTTYADRIELTWQPSALATGYRIYRDGNPRKDDPVAVLDEELSWVDYSLVDWNLHNYYIIAFNENTESGAVGAIGALTRGVGDTSPGGWRMPGADGGHRRAAGVPGPDSAEIGWQRVLDSTVYKAFINELKAEPLYGGDGAIYLIGNTGSRGLLALHPDGSPRWSTYSESLSPVLLDDGSLVTRYNGRFTIIAPNGMRDYEGVTTGPRAAVMSADGDLFGMNETLVCSYGDQGEIQWEYQVEERAPFLDSLTVDDAGLVYFLMDTVPGTGHLADFTDEDPEELHALDSDGNLRWAIYDIHCNGSLAHGTPGRLYACFNGALNALDTADGSVLWSYPLAGDLAINAAGQVVLAAENEVVVLDSDGSPVWSYTPPAGFVCSYPIVDSAGSVYFNEFYTDGADLAGNINRLVALDAGGAYRWDYSQTECGDHAFKSIRDDGSLLWFTLNGEDELPTLTLIAP